MNNKKNKQAEWIWLTDSGMSRFKCSNCGNITTLAYKYCPECGAEITNNIKTKKIN